jgi:hypothetical protein
MTGSWVRPEPVQPYSMCPVLRRHCGAGTPASGTVRSMDSPEVPIWGVLLAPRSVQRAAQALGVQGPVRMRVPGLAEAFDRARAEREPAHV